MMALLIDLGADVDRRGDDDMTPLHYAARYFCTIVVLWKGPCAMYEKSMSSSL